MLDNLDDSVSYKIVRKIADGGMGSVYEATQDGAEGFRKTVAIKTVLPQLATNERFSAMLVEEAKLVSDLVHESIVQIYQLGRLEAGGYYMVLEFIHGVSLLDLILHHRERRRLLPLELSVFIASRIARALAYAHGRLSKEGVPMCIVHRDVSPNNVLITSEGLPKLADFGLALVGSLREGEKRPLVGKLAYISPEQAKREPVDFRSDIFSLGALLFELVSGAIPRMAVAREEYLELAREGVVFWHLLPDGIPSDIRSIIERCLKREPRERYDSTEQLARDLELSIYKSGYGPTIQALEAYLRPIYPKLYRASRI